MQKGNSMIIDLSSALKHPGQSFAFSVEGNIADIQLYGDLIQIKNPVTAEGSVMYTGSSFFVKGSLNAEYTTKCALCYESVHEAVNCEYDEEYIPAESNESVDAYSVTGSTIDITGMIEDNICLHLPLKHTCSDACKGLCPECGCNLNKETCSCDKNVEQSGLENETAVNNKENPFAVLQGMFSDDDEEA